MHEGNETSSSAASEALDKLGLMMKNTSAKLVEISKKAAETTMSAAESTKMALEGAGANVQNKMDDIKKQQKAKKEQKSDFLQDEMNAKKQKITQQGKFDDLPEMVVLPKWEEERLAVSIEQNEAQVVLLEEMQRLSRRVELLGKQVDSIRHSEIPNAELKTKSTNNSVNNVKNSKQSSDEGALSRTFQEGIHLLGTSILFLVVIVAVEQWLTGLDIKTGSTIPLEVIIWSLGTGAWVTYLLYRLGKNSSSLSLPNSIRGQLVITITLVTAMGKLLSDDNAILTNIWLWGLLLAIVALLAVSLVASTSRLGKKILGFE